MREFEFKEYLKAKNYGESTWRTYVSDAKKVARYEGVKGDLDILYANDKFEALLASFSYSKRNGIMPTTDIPTNDDLCNAAASWATCINHYLKFCIESPPNCIQNNPDEVFEDTDFWEGAVRSVLVNQYERNREARPACIKHFGARCIICSFDFESVYEPSGKDFIHVHHLRQISEIKEGYQIDPIADLRPVCPNCHAVIHKRPSPYTINEMKNMVRQFGKYPDPTLNNEGVSCQSFVKISTSQSHL